MDQAHGCELTFTPYVKPGFTASGGASAVVAKGGIYGRGTIANTYMNFFTNIKGFIPSLSGASHLSINIKPFEL